jgi:hypothetical protein
MLQCSAALRQAMLSVTNAVLGSGARFNVYTGPVPAYVEAPADDATLLASLAMSSSPFGVPSGAPGQDVVMLANNLLADSDAAATGRATFFRVVDSAGVAHIQGTAGYTEDADLILNSVDIQIHAAVSVTGPALVLPA